MNIKEEDKEIWIFLSHSNKDYEKVRQVRNMLEEQSLRPLMFFLHCLNDDEEIDALIKREIDCRTRFILCDSDNARKSHWVQREVAYIQSQNRICETIDLSQSTDEIMFTLQEFINKTKIFISYNREVFQLAEMVYKRLSLYDFSTHLNRLWDPHNSQVPKYSLTMRFLKSTVNSGYVVSVMNERILNPKSSSRKELVRAIRDNKSIGKSIPNIIPFVMHSSIVELIQNDPKLCPLMDCDVQSLEGYSIEQQCDEIIKRVVSQLMTPGSIKVQADNFNREANPKEAAFLYELLNK